MLAAASTLLWAAPGAWVASVPVAGASPAVSDSTGARPSQYPPLVVHTGRAPTGYTVTFRYWGPAAQSAQVMGEWSFARATFTGGSTSPASLTTDLEPQQWRRGDFPYPASFGWPEARMTKDARTGVWTYTTPLPSGVFTYEFFVNCLGAAGTGCEEMSDPSNPPWNQSGDTVRGSVEVSSQVYVPADPKFGAVDYWWQGPARRHGELVDLTYPSPNHISPRGTNFLAVYTPPGYNGHRLVPYPTLYLSHGGGGNEVDWGTQGDLRNIMDNLILTGQVQPMVVVMTDFNGFAGSCGVVPWELPPDQDLVSSVIPYIEAHYDVSPEASERAVAGLSCGGDLVETLLANFTDDFGYFGLFSPAQRQLASLTAAQASAARHVATFVGGGWEEPTQDTDGPGPRAIESHDISVLTDDHVAVTADLINGGHEWYVWRILLRDFLTRVAFWPLATS